MRLPTQQHRLERHVSALVGVALVWLCACGCQGPQFDRLDGSPSLFASSQEPVVDNGPPPAHPPKYNAPARDTSALPAGDAVAQSDLNLKATINEKLNRGHREAALKHYEQAELCYRSVLELEPENAIANHRLAVLADRRGDFATSEKYYLAALKREPNDPDLLSDLGYSYLLQGRPMESERCLFAALRANPRHQKARDNLNLLYAKQGDRDRAFEIVKRSVGEAEAHDRLGPLSTPAHPAVREDDTVTASFAPAPSSEVAVDGQTTAPTPVTVPVTAEGSSQPEIQSADAAASTAAAQSGPSSPIAADAAGTPGQSPLEKRLAQLMEQERQHAIEVRAQRESLGSQITPPAQAVTPGESLTASIATEPLPSPAARPVPEAVAAETPNAGNAAGSPVLPTGRVPDDRINDAFAAIDREASDNSQTPTPSADNSPVPPSAAPAPWRTSTAEPRTSVGPQQQSNPLASMPLWPAQSSTRPSAVFQAAAPQISAGQPSTSQTPASAATMPQSTEASSPPPVRPSHDDAAEPRTPSVPTDSSDWDSVRTSAQNAPKASPTNDVPPAPLSATAAANVPQATADSSPWIEENRDPAEPGSSPIGSGTTRPQSADSKDGWDADAGPTPSQWQGGSAVNRADRTQSDNGSRVTSSTVNSQPNQPPRIVPTGILPTGGTPNAVAGHRAPDELDEFEAQLKKNNSKLSAGRSSSNAGVGTKPAAPGDPSAAGREPWSVRIEPRRDLPPLFAPDDSSAKDKKLPTDKPDSFDAGSNWSEVPLWQGAPAARNPGNSTSEQGSGPAIRPGSF
jgi:Tfp pilus assembly protein PilF